VPFLNHCGIPDPEIRAELATCLALARETELAVIAGERLAAARRAVDLARAYDRVLENAGLDSLSAQQQQNVRDQLAPVREQLKKYRLR
jgi:Tat protein secretion system quality control protein TatD with DNase activity